MDRVGTTEKKPHVFCVPLPFQSHVICMLKLAQLLHHKGLQITFVNTEFIHKRLLNSGGILRCHDRSDTVRFETIPDRIPRRSEDDDGSQLHHIETHFSTHFHELATKLSNPPTLIISDGSMINFTFDAVQKLGIPFMFYCSFPACSLMYIYQNQLKHFSSLLRTIDPNNVYPSHIIIQTFYELEASIADGLSSTFPNVYTVGPLQLLLNQMPGNEPECLKWLDSMEPNSVVYVNFGSTTVMSSHDLIELGWGLVDSNHNFLWIIRSDLVAGESAVLPTELEEHIKKRAFIASWCSQEKVLDHPSVGVFLTHGGWGSVLESLSAGVPMICHPFTYDHIIICRCICNEWEVGMEMGKGMKREEVTKLVQELMGERGQRMRNKAIEWKEKARIATSTNGSSSLNVNKLVKEIIMLSRN